jgi:hypothetical protein
MITSSINGHSHSAVHELQCSAAAAAVLLAPRRLPGRAESGTRTVFQTPIHGLADFMYSSRLVIRMTLFALMGCTLPCAAVNLGDATLLSGPTQPLRVEIELASEIQPGLQVKLGSEQSFRENGVAHPAWLDRAQVSLLPAQGLRRRAALLLTASQAAQTQLVELVLEFTWPTGSTQQVYVLLLDASARPKANGAATEAATPTMVAPLADEIAAATPNSVEPTTAANTAQPRLTGGMTFETALRFPFKNREHAGVVSMQRAASPPSGTKQDRLRLAQAKSAQADRIAQERREADQQTRMQELERNARQMRELAADVTAAASRVPLPQAAASSTASAPSPLAVVPAAAPPAASAQKTQAPRLAERSSIWLWLIGFLAALLLAAGVSRFWRTRRRVPEVTDSGGAGRSVFELNPAEAEQAYTAPMRQRQVPVQAVTSRLEDARALFVVGHLADARQLLDTLLQQNPRSHEAWFLLVRVVCAQGDRTGLVDYMPALRKLTGETGELWDRVLVLGQQLDPGNPLYQPAAAPPQTQELPLAPAAQAVAPAVQKPPPSSASSAVDDALRMATAYGARPV